MKHIYLHMHTFFSAICLLIGVWYIMVFWNEWQISTHSHSTYYFICMEFASAYFKKSFIMNTNAFTWSIVECLFLVVHCTLLIAYCVFCICYMSNKLERTFCCCNWKQLLKANIGCFIMNNFISVRKSWITLMWCSQCHVAHNVFHHFDPKKRHAPLKTNVKMLKPI